MQTIQGKIEQKRAEVSRLLEEIDILEQAQALLGTDEPVKRMGRPKGSKNKVSTKKRRSRKAAKKAGTKSRGKRGREPAAAEESAES
jgi:hypothetical protein